MTTDKRNDFIKKQAVWEGEILGLRCFIVPAPMEDALNGYVEFPKRPVREQGYEGLLTYVPVHGGITYANEDEDGMIYGFDTLHHDSSSKPRSNKEWIKKQIEIMIKGILLAKKLEAKYLRCITNKGKAKYAQQIMNLQKEESMNLGVNINLICGKL